MNKGQRLVLSAAVICFAAFSPTVLPSPARATLGEPSASVAKDRRALKAVAKSKTATAKYTIQEIASDATTIREYINGSGTVFAVGWNGLVHPDLTQILGSYSGEFQTAKRAQPRKHGQKRLQVRGNRVVVETWGHMRNLQGRAYLPALLPDGVTKDEIK